MEHVAIDLGGRESQVCARLPDTTIVFERLWKTAKLEKLLGERPHSRVILETSSEAFRVAEVAMQLGHEVRVVPATLVRSLGVGARRMKTDIRDARVLSEVSCRIDLPSVHIPSLEAQRRRAVSRTREALSEARVKLINHVRGHLRRELLPQPPRYAPSFADRVRELHFFAPSRLPSHISNVLVTIEELGVHLGELEEELAAEAKNDPVCKRLMTVPGVGPMTALRYAAAIDQQKRFASAHRVEAYLGLTPGEHSSSERERRLGITKAGPPRVRWLLVQAAWCAMRTRPQDPMVVWATQIALRRGTQVAITALARKLAGILYAIWRDGSTYDPSRGASARPSTN